VKSDFGKEAVLKIGNFRRRQEEKRNKKFSDFWDFLRKRDKI